MESTSADTTVHNGVVHNKSLVRRRLTSARREQNRRAQKNFRARRKEQQDLTEKRVVLEAAIPPLVTGGNPRAKAGLEVDHVERTHYGIHELGDRGGLLHYASGSIIRPGEERLLPPLKTGVSTSASAGDNQARILIPLAPAVIFPADPSTVDMRAMWPIPRKCFHEVYTPPQQSISITKDNYLARTSYCHHCDTSLEQTISASCMFFVPACPSNDLTDRDGNALPCPHKNYIQLIGESCFAATMAIATQLGIARSAYINDHPSLFPLKASSDMLSNGLQCSQLALDLQPTHEQRTIAHPNFLDCIIFPRFRSRAIELSSRGELDLCSLFLDLMHDGLICWGSQFVAGGSETSGGTKGGVPWDRRSWEARPWFLRKWSFLVGDDDVDGMRSGSEWWQGIWGEIGVQTSQDLELSERVAVEEQGAIFSRLGGCNVGIRQTAENDLLVVWNGEQWALSKDLL